MIYIVVEFDKELGVNGSTMEVMPDNWRDHEGNLRVLYPYYQVLRVQCGAHQVCMDERRSFPIIK